MSAKSKTLETPSPLTYSYTQGIYIAADDILKKLMGRSRQEIKLEAIKTQIGVTEEEVDRLVDIEKRILPQVFQQYKV